MSVSAVASLRPLGGQCLRQARTGLLSVRIQSRTAHLQIRAAVLLRPEQRRFQSDLPERDTTSSDGPRRVSQQPKLTLRQLVGRVIMGWFRTAAYIASPKGFRQASRESPVTMAAIVTLSLFTLFLAMIQIRIFYNTFFNPQISKFPEPLASTLRRAIYYTTIQPDPEKARKFYVKALAETRQLNMDPLSDEVLGIKIMVAFWMEKTDLLAPSANALESVRNDCLEWVDAMEQRVKDGKVGPDGRLIKTQEETPAVSQPATESAPTPEQQPAAPSEPKEDEVEEAEEETQWQRRERLLKKAISISVKLGEIYADPHVLDPDSSHRHLVWSVETTLKEFKRRKLEGAKPGEGVWFTPAEVGGTMESLGRDYERKSQFHLAIPLFFQGLRNCDSPCHRAVIMNNLSACFAQHPIYSPAGGGVSGSPETESLKVMFDSSMPNTRKDCLEAAANWARNAYAHARDVQGEDRTPECDEACAVALCNWGDVAAMQGKAELARKKYNQCIELSNKLEFKQGVRQANKGLKLLSTRTANSNN